MVNEIKFSHRYSKMPDEFNGKTALLLSVGMHNVDKLPGKFLDYDTHYFYWIDQELEDAYYQLPKGCNVLVLSLVTDDGIPFTTIRRHTEEKSRYYHGKVGSQFILKLEEVEP